MPRTRRSRAELLQEALLLEQLEAEWQVEHVAAFSGASVGFVYRCDCPRIQKRGYEHAKRLGSVVHFEPAQVREWNAARAIRDG